MCPGNSPQQLCGVPTAVIYALLETNPQHFVGFCPETHYQTLTAVCHLSINPDNFDEHVTVNVVLPGSSWAHLLGSTFLMTAAMTDQNFHQVILPHYARLVRRIVNVLQGAQVLRPGPAGWGWLLDDTVVRGWVTDRRRVMEPWIRRNVMAPDQARRREARLAEIDREIGDVQPGNYTARQRELLNELLDLQPEYGERPQHRPEQRPRAGQDRGQAGQGGGGQPLQTRVARQAFDRCSHRWYAAIHSAERNYNRMLRVAREEATAQEAQRFLQRAAEDGGGFYG